MSIWNEIIMFLKVVLIMSPIWIGLGWTKTLIENKRAKVQRPIDELSHRIDFWVDSILPSKAIVWEKHVYLNKDKTLRGYVLIEVESKEDADNLIEYKKRDKRLDCVEYEILIKGE